MSARGKHLLMAFSGDLILRTHLRMNGSWHIYPSGARWQRPARDMRVLVCTAERVRRRLQYPGRRTAVRAASSSGIASSQSLGPDLLGEPFDRGEVVRRMRARGGDPIAEVLLNQRVLAGIGNVFKSEILFLAGIDPFTPVGRPDRRRSRADRRHFARAARGQRDDPIADAQPRARPPDDAQPGSQ